MIQLHTVCPMSKPRSHAVVYYSRDDHTRHLAQRLADRLDADLLPITTPRYTTRVAGAVRAGIDSLIGSLPPINAVPPLGGYRSVSLGAPIWTSHPATPLRAFLRSKPALPEAVGMFLTCAGASPPEKAFASARALLAHPFVATLGVPNDQSVEQTSKAIDAYCDALLAASGSATVA